MGVLARYWLGRTNQLTHETEWWYFMIIVRGGSGRWQSGVFHADMNQVAGVMCVFKFGLASLVGVPFPPRTVVRVHRSGDTHVSWAFFIFSSQSETSPSPLNPLSSQTVNNPSSTRSLCPCFLGHKAAGEINLWVFVWHLWRETLREGLDLTDFHVSQILRKEILALPCRANQI